jgi:hypothetical protein
MNLQLQFNRYNTMLNIGPRRHCYILSLDSFMSLLVLESILDLST